MADEQGQQTRVLLLNGQTIILQGDAGDNAINEINADLLQQALQEATGSSSAVEEPTGEYSAAPITENNDNLVAIFQGEQGETHTVELTVAEAEALGLHFMSEDSDKPGNDDLSHNGANSQASVRSEENQLVYPNAVPSDEEKPLFDTPASTQNSISSLQQSTTLQDDTNTLQQSIGGMGVVSGVSNYIGDTNITLIPQIVNGQMTYTVKLNESTNSLQSNEFRVMEEDEEEKPKLPIISAMPATTLSAVTTSPSSVVAASLPSICITPAVNTLSSATALQASAVGPSLLVRPSASSGQKTTPSYVFVSAPSSSAISAPIAKQSTSQFLRTTNRTNIPAPPPLQPARHNSSSGATTSTGNASALTGIPLMNSNINITRTSSSSSGLLQSVSTSFTGGGMIRVVAGGTSTRLVPTTTSNGPKFNNILTSSGRLIAATTAGSAVQRILTVNSTANATKTVAVSPAPTVLAVTPQTAPIATPTSTMTTDSSTVVQSSSTRLNVNSTKPLGSSENPIQLVQHGQTFHSVQALSQEQLRQIATVLQQQHLNDSAPPRTKNVLYDPETNTRIIYRVVYPEDFDLREPSSPSSGAVVAGLASRGRGRRGRPPKSAARPIGRASSLEAVSSIVARKPSQTDADLDEDRLADDPGKGERKKQLARTRSGRLSRPPRHMVKDYKRLHHLDFADADLDDSDGGYSDYQMSDRDVEEAEGPVSAVPSAVSDGASAALAGPQPATKRNISSHFRCPTCQKIYLGHSRMARHFEMFPDHGSIEQMKTNPSAAPPSPDSTQGKPLFSPVNGLLRSGPSRRRGKRRGPWAYMTPEARSERRKIKLREVLVTCDAPELLEVAGPSVASAASAWELLLLRVEAVRDESLVTTLCDELRALLERVQAVAGDILQPVDGQDAKGDILKLQDDILCNALGLPSGRYRIVDGPLMSSRCHMGVAMKPMKAEPSPKRLKAEESPRRTEATLREPLCPEVLSALALDRKPVAVSPLSSSAPEKGEEGTGDRVQRVQSTTVQVKAEAEPHMDHQFLLPPATDICMDPIGETDGQGQDLQTVDDIVNERLKNLTGFPVNGPETEPVQDTNRANTDCPDTEVAAFDPEMALAAMGEGNQNVNGTSLSDFTPEIALAAMGEGNGDTQSNTAQPHASFVPTDAEGDFGLGEKQPAPPSSSSSSAQKSPSLVESATREVFSCDTRLEGSSDKTKETPFTSILTNKGNSFITSLAAGAQKCSNDNVQSVVNYDPEMALAAMGEGDGSVRTTEMNTASTFDAELALAGMGEGTAAPAQTFQQGADGSATTPTSGPSFQLTGMDVGLDESGSELYFDTLGAEFTRTTRHS